MPLVVVHSYLGLHQPQMVRLPIMPVLQALALTGKVSEQIHQICPERQKKKKSKNQDKQRSTQQAQAQQNDIGAHTAHLRWVEMLSHPLKGISSPHHPHQVDTCIHPHHHCPWQQVPQLSQIFIQQDPNTAAALQQITQLHQQHFETSQNQTKALKNITSASSFTSMIGCIPIYDGKDKDACTEWLQRCKEASYYTGYNFRLALLQRSSQDVTKVIWSLDEELTHDKLIEEIMCTFSGIPSTAAAIDELSAYINNLVRTLLIYINKYRDLHWWCTKKLAHEETYKLTLSQFCSSLQDPIGRKLCEKLWDDKENCKLLNL